MSKVADEPPESEIFSELKRPKLIKAKTQSKKSGGRAPPPQTKAFTSQDDALAQALTLEQLQQYLNSNDEDGVQHGLRIFSRRMDLDSKAARLAEPGIRVDGLLSQYLESSPQCQEFIAIWDFLQTKDTSRTHVGAQMLDCIEHILRLNDDDRFFSVSSHLAKEIIKKKIHALIQNLASDFNILINATFRLFAALVSLGSAQAREVFRNFNFTYKPIAKLIEKRQHVSKVSNKAYNYEHDVRTNFIRFGLAFLKSDDDSLIEEVLAVKGFLGNVFKNLPADDKRLVKEVIAAFRDHVVINAAVSKKSKSMFFNPTVLDSIVALFNQVTVGDDLDDELADIVYQFLNDLCSSYTTGILYKEPTQYNHSTAAKTRNPSVIRVLHALRPHEHQLQERLVMTILATCPALKREYCDWIKVSLEPRPTLKWHKNMKFVQRVISKVPFEEEYLVSALAAGISPDRVCCWLVPSVVTRLTLSQSIQHTDRLVQYTALNTIVSIVEVAARVQSICQHGKLTDARIDLITAFKKRCPDLQTVLPLLKKVQDRAPEDRPASGDSRTSLLGHRVLVVLTKYLEVFPETFSEAKFDFGRLLVGDPSSLDPASQLQLCRLLRRAINMKWTNKLPGAKETVLSALLRLHLSSPTAGIKKATYELVYNSLLDSSLFQRAEREIDVWLQRLTSEAIPFVETALLQASEEPYTFIDKINSITSVMHSDEFARLSIISAAQSEDVTFPFSLPMMCALMRFPTIVTQDRWSDAQRRAFHSYVASLLAASTSLHSTPLPLALVVADGANVKSMIPLVDSCTPLRLPLEDNDNLLRELFATEGTISEAAARAALLSSSSNGIREHFGDICHLLMARVCSFAPLVDVFAVHRDTSLLRQFKSLHNPSIATLAMLIVRALPADILLHHFIVPASLDQAAVVNRVTLNPYIHTLVVSSLSQSQSIVSAMRSGLYHLTALLQAFDSASGSSSIAEASIHSLLTLLLQVFDEAQKNDVPQEIMEEAASVLLGYPVFKSLVLGTSPCARVVQGSLQVILTTTLSHVRDHNLATRLASPYVEATKQAIRANETQHGGLGYTLLATLHKYIPADSLLSILEQLLDDHQRVGLATSVLSNTLPIIDTESIATTFDLMAKEPFLAKLGGSQNGRPLRLSQRIVNSLLRLATSNLHSTDPQTSLEVDNVLLRAAVSSTCLSASTHDGPLPADLLLHLTADHAINLMENLVTIERSGLVSCAVLSAIAVMDRARIANQAAEIVDKFALSRKAMERTTLTECLQGPSKFLLQLPEHASRMLPILCSLASVSAITPALAAAIRNKYTTLTLSCIIGYSALFEFTAVTAESLEKRDLLLNYTPRFLHEAVLPHLGAHEVSLVLECLLALPIWAVEQMSFAQALLGRLHAPTTDVASLNTRYALMLADSAAAFLKAGQLPAQVGVAVAASVPELCAAPSKQVLKCIKAMLRYGYTQPSVLSIVREAVANPSTTDATKSEVHDLLVSHPSFLDCLYQPETPETKEVLISTLLEVFKTDASKLSNPKLFGVLMSSYTASLSQCDRNLLRIAGLFEQNGVGLRHCGFMWGPLAQQYLVAQAAQRAVAPDDPMDVDEGNNEDIYTILDNAQAMLQDGKLLDSKRVAATLRTFPIHVPLSFGAASPLQQFVKPLDSSDMPYDPSFILAYFDWALSAFDNIDCKKLADVGVLSLAIMGTASLDEAMRQVAYSIISKYEAVLRTIEFREQPELAALLAQLRNSVTLHFQRVSAIIASFVANSVYIVSRVEHPMYLTMCEYLSARTLLEMDSVPMFTSLFLSESAQFHRDREWLLRIICAGVLHPLDLDLLERRKALPLLMAHLSNSLMSSEREREYIWSIITRALQTDVTYRHTLDAGLLVWLGQVIKAAACSLTSVGGAMMLSAKGSSSPEATLANAVSLLGAISALQGISDLSKSSILWAQVSVLSASLLELIRKLQDLPIAATALQHVIDLLSKFTTYEANNGTRTHVAAFGLSLELQVQSTRVAASLASCQLVDSVLDRKICELICSQAKHMPLVISEEATDNVAELIRWVAKRVRLSPSDTLVRWLLAIVSIPSRGLLSQVLAKSGVSSMLRRVFVLFHHQTHREATLALAKVGLALLPALETTSDTSMTNLKLMDAVSSNDAESVIRFLRFILDS